jgi:hypothetical protein
MAGSHASCEQDVTDGHIWGTYPDYIPNVNRMFLLGKCQAKCLNACNVLSMFPPKSRYPCPQCKCVNEREKKDLAKGKKRGQRGENVTGTHTMT